MGVSVWATFGSVTDFVSGAESDSGYCTDICCPGCGDAHLVTLSVMGWFAFSCGKDVVFGQVPDWRRRGVIVVKTGCHLLN
jgi:hypothetical protein